MLYTRMIKGILLALCWAAIHLCAPLAANTLTVTVKCNGQPVQDLPVWVRDSQGTEISDLTTDRNGDFVIDNSETYVAPFMMFYKAYNGSSCGGYFIQVFDNTPDVGSVFLNYYPVELPCSCSRFFQ